MLKFTKLIVLAGVASLVSACSDLPEMGVSFQFQEKHRCSSLSPAITLSDVPEGTQRYRVKLTDRDVPSFDHGGGTVSANGNVIPEGALSSYTGPCPPSGSHTYQFRVLALDADGKAIAVGTSQQRF